MYPTTHAPEVACSLPVSVSNSASTLRGSRVCVCVSGSIAAVKAPELASLLLAAGVHVDMVVSEAAAKLLQATYKGLIPWRQLQEIAEAHSPHTQTDSLLRLENHGHAQRCAAQADAPSLRIWRDADEWFGYQDVGMDPVLHVELAKRNELLLIAPLCANTLADAALGRCGSLLTSILRAWRYSLDPEFSLPIAERFGTYAVNKPVLVAPAMNTIMYHQSITAEHLQTLRARGAAIVPPVSKRLACGDTGMGAMASVDDIVRGVVEMLREYRRNRDLAAAEGKPPFEQ